MALLLFFCSLLFFSLYGGKVRFLLWVLERDLIDTLHVREQSKIVGVLAGKHGESRIQACILGFHGDIGLYLPLVKNLMEGERPASGITNLGIPFIENF